jgi:hypothetical protein
MYVLAAKTMSPKLRWPCRQCAALVDYRVQKILILFIEAIVDRRFMRTTVLIAALVAAVAVGGCDSMVGGGVLDDRSPVPPVDSAPGPADTTPTPPPIDAEFPCDVRAVLETNCAPCHANNAYVVALMTHDVWLSYGQRAAALVRDGKMPPTTAVVRPSADDQALVLAWIDGGMPAGPCGALTPPPR